MFTFADFEKTIEQQLFHNQNKSLFYELANGRLVLGPSKETATLLKQKPEEISLFLQAAKSDGTFQQLLKEASQQTIKLFMEVNQYLDFDREDDQQLKKIYSDLFEQVDMLCKQKELSDKEIEQVFRSHYKKLQNFLLDSNGTEIFKKYRESPDLLNIQCAEYSSEFQMRLLHIQLSGLKQPLLDIGCGPQASLVHCLRENGIESYGMDRNAENDPCIFRENWLDYTFTPNTWGTIISHMAFSNHFMHHHLRPDGDYKRYAEKYMEILIALKPGGRFVYAPNLPFMEEIVSRVNHDYAVKNMQYATAVTKIK